MHRHPHRVHLLEGREEVAGGEVLEGHPVQVDRFTVDDATRVPSSLNFTWRAGASGASGAFVGGGRTTPGVPTRVSTGTRFLKPNGQATIDQLFARTFG